MLLPFLYPQDCSYWVSLTHFVRLARSRACSAPYFRTHGIFHRIVVHILYLLYCFCYCCFYVAVSVVVSFLILLWELMVLMSGFAVMLSFPLEFVPYFPWCFQFSLFAFVFAVDFFITFIVYFSDPVQLAYFFLHIHNI